MEEEIKRLNKSELIRLVADKTNNSYTDVKNIIDTFLSSIEDGLKANNVVTISGFGTFKVEVHKGHPIQFKGGVKQFIDDYPVLKFNVSKVMKDSLRDSYK